MRAPGAGESPPTQAPPPSPLTRAPQSLWQVAQSSTLAASANVANAAANFVRDVSHAGIGAAARATATAAASSMRAVSETAHIPSLEEMQASIADLRESVLTRAGARRRKTKQKPRRRFGDPLKPPPSPGSSPIAMVGQGTVELPRAWNAAASQLARPVADWGTSGHDMESRYRMKFGAVEETYFGESETDSQASADFHDPVPVVEGELDAELDEELEEIQERQYRQMLMIEEAERSLDRKGKGRADS